MDWSEHKQWTCMAAALEGTVTDPPDRTGGLTKDPCRSFSITSVEFQFAVGC